MFRWFKKIFKQPDYMIEYSRNDNKFILKKTVIYKMYPPTKDIISIQIQNTFDDIASAQKEVKKLLEQDRKDKKLEAKNKKYWI